MVNSVCKGKTQGNINKSAMDVSTKSSFAQRPTFFPCSHCKQMFTARALEIHSGMCIGPTAKKPVQIRKRKLTVINTRKHICHLCKKVFSHAAIFKKHLAFGNCKGHAIIACNKPLTSDCDSVSTPFSNCNALENINPVSHTVYNNVKKLDEDPKTITEASGGTDNTNMEHEDLCNNTSQHYPCKICHLVFAHVSNLQEHLKSHTIHDKGYKILIEKSVSVSDEINSSNINYMPSGNCIKISGKATSTIQKPVNEKKDISVVFRPINEIKSSVEHKDSSDVFFKMMLSNELRETGIIVSRSEKERNVSLQQEDCTSILNALEMTNTEQENSNILKSIKDIGSEQSKHENNILSSLLKKTTNEQQTDSSSARRSVIVSSDGIYVCHKCEINFPSEADYLQHALRHETTSYCSVCSSRVPQDKYGEHIIQHCVIKGEKILKCVHCSEIFLSDTLLLVHYRIHIKEPQYFCTECNKSFKQVIALKHHTLSIHGHPDLQPFHCYICFRRFSQPHAISNHMRLHTGDMPYKCQECGRAFTQLGNLQRHLNRHRGEKPHLCQECGKRFADTATLRNHMRTHTGETPYVCTVCERPFSQIGNLKRHMSKHLALRPHCCPDCGKGFAHESTLRNHRRIHTGEQPFKCTVCNRAFSQIGNLKRHMAKHAVQQDFQCGQCHQNFPTSNELVQHECIENLPVSASDEESGPELPIPCHMITEWPKYTSQSQKLLKIRKPGEAIESTLYLHSESANNSRQDAAEHKSDNPFKEEELPANKKSPGANSVSNTDGKTHRKWRIFPCPICGKVYAWQYDLKIHYRIHSGEKPYKCDICGKGFAQSGAVKTHKTRHHQGIDVETIIPYSLFRTNH